jgi:hypothetical protein
MLLALTLLAMSGLVIRAFGAGSGGVGAKVYVDPLSASINVIRMSLKTGQNGKVSASVTNRGSAPVGSVQLSIVAPAGLTVTPGALVLATLAGGATRSSSWTVCGSQAGSFVILARASAVDAAGRSLLAESRGAVITVDGRPKACR